MNLTPEEHYVVKGKIRQAFRQSERFKNTINKARVELAPALKKDGNPGKRNQVRFKCAECQQLFPQKWISVDHIDPVVPLWEKELQMNMGDIVNRIYCDEKNLQVLCSTPMKYLPKGQRSCHSKKTNRENFIRDMFDKEGRPVTPAGVVDLLLVKLKVSAYSCLYDQYLENKMKKEQEKLSKRLAKEEKRKKRNI